MDMYGGSNSTSFVKTVELSVQPGQKKIQFFEEVRRGALCFSFDMNLFAKIPIFPRSRFASPSICTTATICFSTSTMST